MLCDVFEMRLCLGVCCFNGGPVSLVEDERVEGEKRRREERLGDCVDDGGWVLCVRVRSMYGIADWWSLV